MGVAQKTMARLGMPPDSRWFRFRTLGAIPDRGHYFLRYEWLAALPHHVAAHTRESLPGDWKDWTACRVEGFGKLLPKPGDAAVSGPTWSFEFPAPMPDLHVQMWECRVIPPGGPLFAELQWRPGYPDGRPYIGGWPRARPSNDVINAAWNALDLVWALERETRRGMTDQEALEEAVTLGREWLGHHPNAIQSDFGCDQLAAMKCIDRDSLDKWMTRKHFNIKKVHQRLV